MRIKVLLVFIIFYQSSVYANIQEYIDSFTKTIDNDMYKTFTEVMKGSATISDIEKHNIIDNDISNELNTPFIYTDLANCIKIALEKNYLIKVSDAYKKQYYWLYKNADVSVLPDIYYDYRIQYLGGHYLVGGIVSLTTHEIPIQSMFMFEWSTFNQGKYFFLVSQAKNIFESSIAELEFTKEKIIRDVVLAYYDLLEKKLEIEVQKVNLYDRLEQLKYTNSRYEAGLGTLYDIKRAQAEFAGAQQDYTTTLNSLKLRQAHLANILGIDVLDAVYPYEIEVDLRTLINPDCEIEKLYLQALSGREDIRAKKAEINAYRAQRSSNYTDVIPEVIFSYQNGWAGTKRVGLKGNNSLTLDIRAHLGKNMLLGTITKIKSDTEQVRAKKLELINLQRDIKENILSYYYDSINALKKIEAAKVEKESADVSLYLALTNMKAGEATFIDVISSQNLKIQANINLIKNMIEYNKAQTNLLFEIGILSPKNVLRGYKEKFY
ncbi:TolC family protein [bacterium]|nr:TolC family protein [bacterium]